MPRSLLPEEDLRALDPTPTVSSLAPKSAADFAFLLHGFHYLKDEGVMAIILPHGVLFRGGAEQRIRTKLLQDGHIDTIIGLPANLFYSTGIPVCILVLKKCKKPDDVLFINAAEHFVKGKRQNQLAPEQIARIVETYQNRTEEARYSRRVEMAEIEKNDFNLNISRYISTAVGEAEIGGLQPLRLGPGNGGRGIVPDDDAGAARRQRERRGKAGTAEPEQRDGLGSEALDGGHGAVLSGV